MEKIVEFKIPIRFYTAYKINGKLAKKCCSCGKIKLLKYFHARNNVVLNRSSECKECSKVRQKNRSRESREKHKKSHKIWLKNHPEKVIEYRNKYKKKYGRDYINKKYRSYLKKRKATDINYRIRMKLEKSMYSFLKSRRFSATSKKLLGCSIPEFKQYMSKKFRDGMSWDNHGKLWEIDHIFPLSKFDLADEYQRKIAFNFNNMQPLLRTENREKSDKVFPYDFDYSSLKKKE